MVLGLLGLGAQDKETALPHLQQAHALAQSSLDGDSGPDEDSARRVLAYWADKVEQAAKLP
jgi:hypothetical protein